MNGGLTRASGRSCLTPGAIYRISVTSDLAVYERAKVEVDVEVPVAIDSGQAAALERSIHDALESALSPLFQGPDG